MILEHLTSISYLLYKPLMLKAFAAIAIFLIGLIVGHLSSNALKRLLNELGVDKALKFFNLTFSIEKLLSTFIRYLIYIAAFLQALNIVGIATPLLNIIILVFTLIFLLSVLIFLKDFFPNAIAGLRLKHNKNLSIGDHVIVSDVNGVIEAVGLLETRISSKGSVFMIPNKKFLEGFSVIKKKKHETKTKKQTTKTQIKH